MGTRVPQKVSSFVNAGSGNDDFVGAVLGKAPAAAFLGAPSSSYDGLCGFVWFRVRIDELGEVRTSLPGSGSC